MFAVIALPAGVDELNEAIRSNDILRVTAVIERYGSNTVNSPIHCGVTPLHLAAALNRRAVAALLMYRGAEPGTGTEGGFTPLHWAASRDSADVAELLISHNVDINAAACNGITPLHWAANKNATNVAALLIRSGADIGATTDSGLTPLHWAVMDEANDTAVMIAFKTVSKEMDRTLLKSTPAGKTKENKRTAKRRIRHVIRSILPGKSLGKTLTISIGHGESLAFVCVDDRKLWVGKYEITNGQYRRFDPKHKSMYREGFSLDEKEQPVVYVSWNEAKEFCGWLNRTFRDKLPRGCEFRLPTEREWITSAKCQDDREYPWGNRWPPRYGNYSDRTAKKHFSDWKGIKNYDDGFAVTCPVTESGVNEWGIYGLAGNVWEWCGDWYGASEEYKVHHGGSWDFDEKRNLRIDARGFDRPDALYDTIGFRVVIGEKL